MEYSESAIRDSMDFSGVDLCSSIVNEVKYRPPVTISMMDGTFAWLQNEAEARLFLKVQFNWEGSDG